MKFLWLCQQSIFCQSVFWADPKKRENGLRSLVTLLCVCCSCTPFSLESECPIPLCAASLPKMMQPLGWKIFALCVNEINSCAFSISQIVNGSDIITKTEDNCGPFFGPEHFTQKALFFGRSLERASWLLCCGAVIPNFLWFST